MRDLRTLFYVAALALPALSRPSAAQAPGSAPAPTIAAAPVEAMTAKARELYADGLKAFQQQKWSEAYAAFTGAWALQKHYSVAGNLGAAEMQLGRHRDAAEHLAIYVAGIMADAKRSPKERESARLLLEAAAAKVVAVTVSVNEAGADVWLDGARVGAAPLGEAVFVEPGKHTLEVRLEGYVTDKRDFDGAAGEKKAIEVTLRKRAEVVPSVSASASATAASAASTTPAASSTVAPARSLAPAFVIGGVGIASLLAGGVLFGVHKAQEGEIRDQMPRDANGDPLCVRPSAASGGPAECAALVAKTEEANALGNAGIVLFGVGGAAFAGVALYLLLPAPKPAPGAATSRLLPVVTNREAGLLWIGSF